MRCRFKFARVSLFSVSALMLAFSVACAEVQESERSGTSDSTKSQSSLEEESAQTAKRKADALEDTYDPRNINVYAPKMHWSGAYSYAKTDIKTHDGITLRAVVTEPAGPGPHPLIVMPSSWAFNRIEYSVPARLWAQQGFVVVSYTSRGFYRSGGKVDVSGPPTVKDVSSIIDWAGKNTKADLDRVGVLGISYGAGTSLLAAAQEPRIGAVVSMSGWADLNASMIPNNTVANQIAQLLTFAAKIMGKPGPLLQEVQSIIDEDRLDELVEPFKKRSAVHCVEKLKNKPVLLVHAWNDGAFPLSHIVDFYKKLEGPKSLLMQPGDHATADMGGLLGLSNRSWDSALCWMKKHLKKEQVDCGPKIVSISNDNKWERSADSYEQWKGKMTSFTLSDPWMIRWLKLGVIQSGTKNNSWSRSIQTGIDTVANSGTVMLAGAKLRLFSMPEMISSAFVLRDHALIWKTREILKSQHVVGTPEITFNIKAQDEKVSLFAYLYEEVAGVSSLISHAPITFRDLKPGSTVPVSLKMQPIDWNLVPGSQLVLVIDSKDPRYLSESGRAELEVLSTPDHPAMLKVPLREDK